MGAAPPRQLYWFLIPAPPRLAIPRASRAASYHLTSAPCPQAASPKASLLGGPSYRAISHLLTSRPLLGMLPMPRWGSLLVNVFRKWM